MPKSVKFYKKEGRAIREVVCTKHRIGTRKSGTSATLMSNAALEAVIADESKAKYHHNARAVLRLRV